MTLLFPDAGPPQRVLVAVATYNERDNLAPLVAAIRGAAAAGDVLIIDDASPDGTGARADALARADAKIRVIHRAGKQGLGTAILAMMHYAMAHDYDALVTLDPYTGFTGPHIVSAAATADTRTALASLSALAATGARTLLPGHGLPDHGGIAAAVEQAVARGAT